MSCPRCGMSNCVNAPNGGRGSGSGAGGGGRWRNPENLSQQLALEEAKANKGREIMGGQINDPKYPSKEWAKMEWIHRALDGSNMSIHYWQNRTTGVKEEFKFTKN